MAPTLEAPSAQVDELIHLLEEMQSVIAMLSDEERLKTEAFGSRDLTALEQISARQELMSSGLRELENERQRLVVAMTGDAASSLTVRQLADRIGGPQGARLLQTGEGVVARVESWRQTTHENAGILQWAADLAQKMAQWLLGNGQDLPTYTRAGTRRVESQLSARDWTA